MKLATRLVLGLSLGLLAAACEDDPHDLDFLKVVDAGKKDAGMTTDSSVPSVDSGSGTPMVDSGSPMVDAGGTGSDAGGADSGAAN